MQKPLDFKCPHCATAYQVVKVQTDTYTDAEIDCLVCGQAAQCPLFLGKYPLRGADLTSFRRGHCDNAISLADHFHSLVLVQIAT